MPRTNHSWRILFCLLLLPPGFLVGGCGKVEREKLKRRAPEGTFYTVQQVVMSSSNGLIRMAPGTRLTRISGDGATLTVKTDAGQELQVSRDMLTDDLDTAALSRKSDSESHREFSERVKAEREATAAKNPKQ
jgi:hypothetical protein